MKAIKQFSLAILCLGFVATTQAQSKTETFKVSGNCGMCKSTIEKAAKSAGATSATWDEETKDLVVTYKSSTTNAAKIQQKIAMAGYDNAGAKASNESYDKLHGCCKYERSTTNAAMDCCKDGKCSKPGHDGKDCCKEKMDCCQDGKCAQAGHDGKDCCKKN